MKSLFTKRSMLTDAETPAAFQARRRAIRVPMVLFLATFVLDLTVDAMNSFPMAYNYVRGVIYVVFCLIIIFAYRCPRCGDAPKSHQAGTSGVLIFPRKCSKCGAPLMPDHKWAQD